MVACGASRSGLTDKAFPKLTPARPVSNDLRQGTRCVSEL